MTVKKRGLTIAIAVVVLAGLGMALHAHRTIQLHDEVEEAVVLLKLGRYAESMELFLPLAEIDYEYAVRDLRASCDVGLRTFEFRSNSSSVKDDNPNLSSPDRFLEIARQLSSDEQMFLKEIEPRFWYTCAALKGHKESQRLVTEGYRYGRYGALRNRPRAIFLRHSFDD